MEKLKIITLKVLYGLLFVAVIPYLLILWAKHTRGIINLPMPEAEWPGHILAISGILLMISGILHLWILGKGLPMNAFPPEKIVKRGIYAVTKHPIYTGAILLSFGLSVIFNSSSGFWLVSPLFTLMTVAYVIGYENDRTRIISGDHDYTTFLSLPEPGNIVPSASDIISAYLVAYLPWLIVYEAFIFSGTPIDAIITNLPFEERLPVWGFSEVLYFSTYLFALLIPLVIKTREQLRSFIIDVWFVTAIGGIIFLAFPFVVKQRVFIPSSFTSDLILLERSLDGETAALPSFHVIWAWIAARYFARNIARFNWVWYTLAVLISVSCITTGSHSFIDVIAGFCLYIMAVYRLKIWDFIRFLAEKLANSWHEWRLGPVRIINHGFYGGAAGFTGTLLAGFFLGSHYALAVSLVMILAITGAGLWAQLIEGSPKLQRPYGYYGGVIGVISGSLLVSIIFSAGIWVVLAAFAMAGPWIQAIGRLRCLVQGCCHGKPSSDKTGIRFTHPYSRVNKISGLKGIPLHPTQLYSIGSNLISGLILFRLYSLHMPAVFIIGIYLILNGTGRFVEESLRGETQTPYWLGMRIYQWIAIINIFIGAIFTTIHDSQTLTFQFNTLSVFMAVFIGFIVTIASGVDFPESNRRFARLTSN